MNEQMRLLQGSWGEIITLSIIYRSLKDGRNDVSSSSFSEEAKNTVSSKNVVKEQQSSFNSIQVKLKITGEVSFDYTLFSPANSSYDPQYMSIHTRLRHLFRKHSKASSQEPELFLNGIKMGSIRPHKNRRYKLMSLTQEQSKMQQSINASRTSYILPQIFH